VEHGCDHQTDTARSVVTFVANCDRTDGQSSPAESAV
jgi:hypothetical protein